MKFIRKYPFELIAFGMVLFGVLMTGSLWALLWALLCAGCFAYFIHEQKKLEQVELDKDEFDR